MYKSDFSEYDSMTDDQLEALLLADFDHPDAELLDVDEIVHICEIISERRKINQPEDAIDINRMWEDFIKYYAPEEFRADSRAAHERNKSTETQTL